MKVMSCFAILVGLAVIAPARSAGAQDASGVAFNRNLCLAPGAMKTAAGTAVDECKQACDAAEAGVIDNAFVTAAQACRSKAAANAHAPDKAGGGGISAAGWVSVVTDFFVARLKGESALFLKEKVASQLCPAKEHALITKLLPATCRVMHGDDAGIAALPAAFRTDVEALPQSAFSYLLDLTKAQPASMTKVLCLGVVAPGPLRALRKTGPVAALQLLVKVSSPHPSCEPIIAEARDVASWILQQLAGVAPAKRTYAEIQQQVTKQAQSLLVGRAGLGTGAPSAADLAKLRDRWSAIEPLLTELILLLRQIEEKGPTPETMDRAAELTTLIWVQLIELDEATQQDLANASRAISAFVTKRYLEGVLTLLTVKTLDEQLKANTAWKKLGEWAPVLASLAEAKTTEEAQKILEAAAAPLGSYRQFTEGGWKGFISGWAALGGGRDWMFAQDGNEGAGAFGPMLPIGFEIGHPISDEGTSLQLLFSVIDVGAPAIARFDGSGESGEDGKDGEVKLDGETSFSSVFAPGLFVGIRPGKWPFVIGGGAEFLPSAVAKFDCDEGVAVCSDTTSTPTIRFMGFVAFDLTAFRIF